MQCRRAKEGKGFEAGVGQVWALPAEGEAVPLKHLLQLMLGQQQRSRFTESCDYWSKRKRLRSGLSVTELCGVSACTLGVPDLVGSRLPAVTECPLRSIRPGNHCPLLLGCVGKTDPTVTA